MTTKLPPTNKKIKVKQIVTEGPRFFAPIKHSRNSPPSLTGWADDSKSSFAMVHSIDEKRLPTEKDLDASQKPLTQSPSNGKNIVALLTSTKVYEKSNLTPHPPKPIIPTLLTRQAKLGYDFQTKLDPSYEKGHEMRPRRPVSNAQTSRDLLVPSYPKLLMENMQREETILSVKRFKGRTPDLTASVPIQKKVIKEVTILPLPKESRSKVVVHRQVFSHREMERDGLRSRDSSACSSPRPYTSLYKKRRVPAGCFKAMDAGNSFSRKTYMGISRVTAGVGRASLGESVLESYIHHDEGKNLANKSQQGNGLQTALTSRRESRVEERQRIMTAAVIAKRGGSIATAIVNNYNSRINAGGGLNLEAINSSEAGVVAERQLKSMIQMPANIGRIQNFVTVESPHSVQMNLLEKLKVKIKNNLNNNSSQQQYRPKSFLKTFKPKAKEMVSVNANGDLIIQPLRSEHNNTSLLIGEKLF